MNYLALIFILVVLVYIWNKTDAIPEYASLFKLKFIKSKDFFELKNKLDVSYPEFLILKSENFCTKLLNCPICLLCFLNIISFLVFRFNFKMIGFNIFWSWTLYFFLLWLGKKTDE